MYCFSHMFIINNYNDICQACLMSLVICHQYSVFDPKFDQEVYSVESLVVICHDTYTKSRYVVYLHGIHKF